jgi:hypothetical protein
MLSVDDVEALNDLVVDWLGPCVLKELGEVRSDLLQVRRILSAMRDRLAAFLDIYFAPTELPRPPRP